MLLKRIKLKNIRSFVDEEIQFQEGTSLLAGDIGTGKSTILQAAEFSLFGVRRGEVTGNSLLRNGSDEGSIELELSIAGKDILINRTLKRGTNGVSQDFGFLSINGIGKEYTSTEMKQRVLELINYPSETLTKKSMIYRYTVYTPQEEMKAILSGSEEDRLETLRKVFNVDKYKRIRENAKILNSRLREKRKELAGKSYDLEQKKMEKEEKERRLEALQKAVEKTQEELKRKEEETMKKREDITKQEERITKLNIRRKQIAVNELDLKNKMQMLDKTAREIDQLKKELQELGEEKEQGNWKEELKKKEEELQNIDNKIRELQVKAQDIKTRKKGSEELNKKIKELDQCPTCLQDVNEQHKCKISEVEEIKIKDLEKALDTLSKEEQELHQKLEELKKNLKELQKKDKEAELQKYKQEQGKKKKEILERLEKERAETEKELQEIKEIIEKLGKELGEEANIEQQYTKIKEEYEKEQEKLKEIEVKKASLSKEYNLEQDNITRLGKELKEKEEAKKKFDEYNKLQGWIQEHFIKIMETIEKNVMQRVYNDFNLLFQKWFRILIEDETTSVKLDRDFSPKIEQNGYDIDYQNLSGGEKTSAALAYRLSLNQVINDVVAHINTKDLIMLDEPTDGFSTEQIHKLRDVLDELRMRQVLIVSHEQEIEGFVDNIIKLQKEEHVSRALN